MSLSNTTCSGGCVGVVYDIPVDNTPVALRADSFRLSFRRIGFDSQLQVFCFCFIVNKEVLHGLFRVFLGGVAG